LRQLLDEQVRLAGTPGGANAGHKAMTLIHSALAGGECIDDAEALRAGATQAVLGHEVRAPSTLGTFLRSFTWGHVRQLDRVASKALTRAWAAGARPGKPTETITIDWTPRSAKPMARRSRARRSPTRAYMATIRCSPAWLRVGRWSMRDCAVATPTPVEAPLVSLPRASAESGRQG
jgi:hypothetical protein